MCLGKLRHLRGEIRHPLRGNSVTQKNGTPAHNILYDIDLHNNMQSSIERVVSVCMRSCVCVRAWERERGRQRLRDRQKRQTEKVCLNPYPRCSCQFHLLLFFFSACKCIFICQIGIKKKKRSLPTLLDLDSLSKLNQLTTGAWNTQTGSGKENCASAPC